MSSTAIISGTISLTGSNLNIGDSTVVVLTNNVTLVETDVTPNTFNESHINFTLPTSL